MSEQSAKAKSPYILLFILGLLVIATLAVISNYFLRPSLEENLKQSISLALDKNHFQRIAISVKGRDVIISGNIKTESEQVQIKKIVESIDGIRHVESELVIKNQTFE